MGIADKVRNRQAALRTQREQRAEESQTGSTSTTLVVAEPGHIVRLKGVVRILQDLMATSDDNMGMGQFAYLMGTLTDELAEELGEKDETQVRVILYQFGEVIAWIGHGDNERLPEAIREFAEKICPTSGGDNVSTTDRQPGSHKELDS